ncbi:class I poly(R)-hydroxyalkanoic acid synthase [Pontixanthobacter gangjinensis]|uniref:Class I poly(R)-hydroxyalkanoic acid synthase n=1 Tax=Pontixanthobacter gangjinensis TaxID=1028742 RepID=A0A6I4SKB2_9SPHN|nr:class I poly(R)-hydroxyalkanoic acid synthase [Pontixanthobacter gangjinensis]MXO56135.1 class I poly(R)-hydroxyalkanoic acid synthase [Pontixanthobacter gangjinensis]
MTDKTDPAAPFTEIMRAQSEAMREMMSKFMPGAQMPDITSEAGPPPMTGWPEAASALQKMWLDFQAEQKTGDAAKLALTDPLHWAGLMQNWYQQMPIGEPEKQQRLWTESLALWQNVLGRFGFGPDADLTKDGELPRKDRRFADDKWTKQPAFALIHQTYLLMSERLQDMVDEIEGLPESKREQLRFATRAMTEAMSPANFPLTNPLVLEKTVETKGQNLVRGMEHFTNDLKKGQLTHVDPDAFKVGENIAITPGKVVYETDLFQLIQYSPTTDKVLETPLVIFPPWINRFYILDLNPKKSFVRWAVEQGISTFMVSWKSADASMADVVWDDYILAQIDAIEHIRKRLKVPSVHAIGYCVAGTTLAATLAILHRRKQQDIVKSATFFTAQVDFGNAGELLHFIDDQQLESIEQLTSDGYLDGRYMAAAFNMLRGTDLIWNYWINNYLMGNGYPAFDLLHWNGDVTNLPAKWHQAYLRDLYRDNKLVTPDAMSADGTAIDLKLVETPTYIQAGREDHIAPAESVWRMTDHFQGPMRFVLAGSGHIAGVVNPPGSGKYQYWLNDDNVASLDEFIAGATETAGSWWPDWIEWLRSQDSNMVAAKGKRRPGGKNDKVIEDAPGRYVKSR